MIDNLKAFLGMIAHSEIGPGLLAVSDNGYNVVVGSTPRVPILFHDYSDHPRMRINIRAGLISSAAGRYQILARYFDAYKQQINLPDFSPASQDAIAMQMIKECRALDDIKVGRLATAIAKCKSRWASLPGAGYNQREVSYTMLAAAFVAAGGTLA